MGRTFTACRVPRHAQSLPACLRPFLTPDVWTQARRHLVATRRPTRWDFHHLILVVRAMTWSLGESTPERFEMARGIGALCRPERRRAGVTAQGVQKASVRWPMRPLVALAAAVRHRLRKVLGEDLYVPGFLPLGCDGSRLECCRNDDLLARLGQAGKPHSAPMLWVSALVHLTTGIPWSWRLGQGTACERDPRKHLIATLPACALVIADAGFHGDDLAAARLAAQSSFLIRMSSNVRRFVDAPVDRERFTQRMVTYGPVEARQKQRPPLRLRRICVRGRRRVQGRRRKVDVWLWTNVSAQRMSVSHAAFYYRLRWENEGLFRTYQRTWSKVRLVGRTVRAVPRAAYGSLLSCQLLRAQGAWALRQRREGRRPSCRAARGRRSGCGARN